MRKYYEVIYVKTLRDSRIADIIDDVMIPLSPGVSFHVRLQLLIVVEEDLMFDAGNFLPIT
jgi:hypothetical protein